MVVQMNIECKQDVAMGSVTQSNANKSQIYVGQDHLNAVHRDGANAPLLLSAKRKSLGIYDNSCLDHQLVVERIRPSQQVLMPAMDQLFDHDSLTDMCCMLSGDRLAGSTWSKDTSWFMSKSA